MALFVLLANMSNFGLVNMTGLPRMIPLLTAEQIVPLSVKSFQLRLRPPQQNHQLKCHLMIQVVRWLTCCHHPMLKNLGRFSSVMESNVMLANMCNVELVNMKGLLRMNVLLIGELTMAL